MTIRIGTRKSKLALWQAFYVKEALERKGAQVEIADIETKGDKQLKVSIAEIGSKGVFTEELEEMLSTGEVDIAVHSAKDMQSDLGENFEIIAFSKREEANDVIVSANAKAKLTENIVIGTSSARRTALLKYHYPHIKTVSVRGNLQTRIQKMKDGTCDALLLAYAGVHRMAYDHMITEKIPLDIFVPAAGQGAIAIESAINLDQSKKKFIIDTLHHEETGYRLEAERSFLKRLEGGCSIPAFCYARLEGIELIVTGGIIATGGEEIVTKEIRGDVSKANSIGLELAEKVLISGGEQILKGIKEYKEKDA